MAPEVWIIIIFISIVLSIAWADGLDTMGREQDDTLKKEWEEAWGESENSF